MWWSYVWHYYDHLFKRTEQGKKQMEAWIFTKKLISSKHKTLNAFANLSAECKVINQESKDMNYNEKFEDFYRDYMGLYLKLRFIDGMIEPLTRIEPDTMLYSALIFPTILFWIQAFDEVYGRSFGVDKIERWNGLRFIQFEWMYANQRKSFNMIHCWIVYGKYDCNEFKDDDTFETVLRKERRSFGEPSKSWNEKVWGMYKDCSHSLQDILLKDRPNLLMGQWIDWEN